MFLESDKYGRIRSRKNTLRRKFESMAVSETADNEPLPKKLKKRRKIIPLSKVSLDRDGNVIAKWVLKMIAAETVNVLTGRKVGRVFSRAEFQNN